MCGINGIAYKSSGGRRVEESVLLAMRDVITHRGPDGEGAYLNKNIGLGHRRLSIVDVAHGAQPMYDASREIALVFNGEIYNHAESRRELETKNYRYQTSSDTETILNLYQEYGLDCVEKLRGMFAFAIWDDAKKRLFVARDRLGIKPLYYVHDERGNLYFGSEIKSLIAAGAVNPALNYNALPDQLANHGTSLDETLYEGVKRLMPGHFMVWEDGRLDIKKYWDISFEPKEKLASDQEYIDQWLAEFENCVKQHLMSDVPLGLFLSGGIDSSAICALMSKMVDEPIQTFSVGFKEREANEFEYARIVSEAFGTKHREVTLEPGEFIEALPNLIWHEDEPLGFSASIPLFFVSKLAQEHVKVVLTGEGSDELMAGYGRYRKAVRLLAAGEKYEAFTPTALRKVVKSGVGALPGTIGKKLERTFLSRDANVEGLFFDNFAIFPRHVQNRIFTDDAKNRIGDLNPYRGLNDWFEASDAEDVLDKILYTDSKTYLQELLMKQDQMSMAASIESRVPFLDHVLVELTARMPVEMKLRGSETKWILRRAMRGILPDVILDRPKLGFPVPLGRWLRSEFRHVTEEFVLSERALSRGIFEPDIVREIASDHFKGIDREAQVFFLLNFEIWYRKIIEGEDVVIKAV